MVPEALCLQWDILGLHISWGCELGWHSVMHWGVHQWPSSADWSFELTSTAWVHSQASSSHQKMRQRKSKQPPGTNKLCMPMLSSYFACAVYIFQDSPPVTRTNIALRVFLPWKQGKKLERAHTLRSSVENQRLTREPQVPEGFE